MPLNSLEKMDCKNSYCSGQNKLNNRLRNTILHKFSSQQISRRKPEFRLTSDKNHSLSIPDLSDSGPYQLSNTIRQTTIN